MVKQKQKIHCSISMDCDKRLRHFDIQVHTNINTQTAGIMVYLTNEIKRNANILVKWIFKP